MKIFIENRRKQKVCVLIDKPKEPKGLAFVMHGLSGNKEQAHIQAVAESFLNNNYTVIKFDTTNTFGESEGNYADATITNYYEDLEDVIKWTKLQEFYQEPFILAGHSLGGISIVLYSQRYPEEVKALAPISTIISGKLSLEVPKYNNHVEMISRGWIEEKKGVKLKWSHMEDRMKYDILKNTDKLTMPVLMIVGELDENTPYNHQKLLFDKLTGRKEIHIIKNAPHTFKEDTHLQELKVIFDKWIKRLHN